MSDLAKLIPFTNRGPGLSDSELEHVEETGVVRFPDDLRDLLRETLPHGDGFPDWLRPAETMGRWRAAILEGILFDVTRNGFWPEAWGLRVENGDLTEFVKAKLADAPQLIPIYQHRAIPSPPLAAGNPVFSVVQADVVIYGADLREYLHNEFSRSKDAPLVRAARARMIPFWTALVADENSPA